MYAIVCVEKSDPSCDWNTAMRQFLNNKQQAEGVTILREGAWLIHLDTASLWFANLLTCCNRVALCPSVAFFESQPTFFSVPQKA